VFVQSASINVKETKDSTEASVNCHFPGAQRRGICCWDLGYALGTPRLQGGSEWRARERHMAVDFVRRRTTIG
jgi:hypothetical protein